MPFGDGTGPWWANGRRDTGWGRGFGRRAGFGRGFGRGFGWGWRNYDDYYDATEEKSWLKREIDALTERLNFLKRKLDDYDKK